MKWREKRNPTVWYRGPDEGKVIHYATSRGKKYTVQAYWRDAHQPERGIVWYSFDGNGCNLPWINKEAAIEWCERDLQPVKAKR